MTIQRQTNHPKPKSPEKPFLTPSPDPLLTQLMSFWKSTRVTSEVYPVQS